MDPEVLSFGEEVIGVVEVLHGEAVIVAVEDLEDSEEVILVVGVQEEIGNLIGFSQPELIPVFKEETTLFLHFGMNDHLPIPIGRIFTAFQYTTGSTLFRHRLSINQ